jgi:hypothetical protein
MFQKYCVSLALVVAGVLCSVSWVQAQEQEPKKSKQINIRLEGPAMEMLGLLRTDKFKTEFNLTDEQKTKLAEAEKEMKTAIREGLSGVSPADREEFQRKIGEVVKEAEKKIGEQIKEILKPEQMARLKEIQLQIAGPRALLNPEIRKALKLNDEQEKQIKSLGDEFQKNVKEVVKEAQGLSPEERDSKKSEYQEKIKKMITEFGEKAAAVLTPE